MVALEANLLLDIGLDEDTVSECLAHGYVWDDPLPPFPEADPDDDERWQGDSHELEE